VVCVSVCVCVCVCVCLLVTFVSTAKTAEPIDMLFGVELGEPKEPPIRWGANPPRERAIILEGNGGPL